MSVIDDNLKKLNIILPDPKGPVAGFDPVLGGENPLLRKALKKIKRKKK